MNPYAPPANTGTRKQTSDTTVATVLLLVAIITIASSMVAYSLAIGERSPEVIAMHAVDCLAFSIMSTASCGMAAVAYLRLSDRRKREL